MIMSSDVNELALIDLDERRIEVIKMVDDLSKNDKLAEERLIDLL